MLSDTDPKVNHEVKHESGDNGSLEDTQADEGAGSELDEEDEEDDIPRLTREIAVLEQELAALPTDSPDRGPPLSQLGTALFDLWALNHDFDTITLAIANGRERIALFRPGHPDRAGALEDLGCFLNRRALHYETHADLVEAIACLREALALAPADDNYDCLHALAHSLRWHCAAMGDLAAVQEAIELDRAAMATLDESEELSIVDSCSRLALALFLYYQETGLPAALEESISLSQRAVQLCPVEHSWRPSLVRELALSLQHRADVGGDLGDLEKAYNVGSELLKLNPPGHPLFHKSLADQAEALCLYFLKTNQVSYLDEAIEKSQQALSAYPSAEENYVLVSRLGKYILERHLHLHDPTALAEALDLMERSLKLIPDDMTSTRTDRARVLTNFGVALSMHANGNLAMHDKAVALARDTLAMYEGNGSERVYALCQLATNLCNRAVSLSDVPAFMDLGQAVECGRSAMAICAERGQNQADVMINLSISLRAYYTRGGAPQCLEEAIQLQQQAMELSAPGTGTYMNALEQLANSLLNLYDESKNISDLEAGVAHFETFANSEGLSPRIRLTRLALRIRTLIDDLSDLTDQARPRFAAALRMCRATVSLLPRVAYNGLESSSQLAVLSDVQSLGADGAIVALALGNTEKALELLEEARAVFWAQALRLRTPLGDLPAHEADRLSRLFRILDSEHKGDASKQDVLVRRRAIKEMETLLADIRQRPQFKHFLLGQSFRSLVTVASAGYVVVLIAHQRACEAVVLCYPEGNVQRIPLRGLSVEDVESLAVRVKRDNVRMRGGLANGSSTTGIDDHDPDAVYTLADDHLMENERTNRASRINRRPTDVMGQLWSRIVQPIIAALGLKKQKGRDRPRLHWCPTGAFAFLPLHAALPTGKEGQGCSDFFVSSYTPTLTALLHARRDLSPLQPHRCHALLVAESNAPGMTTLAQANDEVLMVERMLSASVRTTVLGNMPNAKSVATASTVLENVSSAAILHLACHGEQNPSNPLQSGFELHDGRLSVARLMELNLREAHLAFLSACETAKGDSAQPDQAVHLAAAMLFVGFRSVIATMWSMNDADGPLVAQTVYSELLKTDSWEAADVPYALDSAVRNLREQSAPAYRWAPYIHMGA